MESYRTLCHRPVGYMQFIFYYSDVKDDRLLLLLKVFLIKNYMLTLLYVNL